MKKVRALAVAAALVAAAASTSPAVAGAIGSHPAVALPATGPGWLVAAWTPHPTSSHPARYVELVSPAGSRYVLYRLHNLATQIDDWSGDATRLLLVTGGASTSTIGVVDLATGAVEHSFTVNVSNVAATFTRPAGLAIYVNGGARLTRDSLTGSVETRFPAAESGLGAWTGSWLESPNGVSVVLGMQHGLALLTNTGTLVAKLPTSLGTYCRPMRWWSSGTVLGSCADKRNPALTQLLEFSVSGGAATQFVRIPRGGYGYTDAYQVGSKVFLQGAVTCGLPYLAELNGTTPVPVSPHVRGSGDEVVATTSTALALLSSGGGCTGQNFVSWYTPASDSVVQVLGAPLSSGGVVPISYPNPISTGSPASAPYQ